MTEEEEHEYWKQHIYGDMPDEELAKLHQRAASALQVVAKKANNGDHSFDILAPSLERIITATDEFRQRRRS